MEYPQYISDLNPFPYVFIACLDHQLQTKALTSLEDKALDCELIKPLAKDDNELNKLHMENSPTYCDHVKQQTETLNSPADEALGTELNKTIHIDDVESNKLHLQDSSTCCEMSGFYFMDDTIIDIDPICRY